MWLANSLCEEILLDLRQTQRLSATLLPAFRIFHGEFFINVGLLRGMKRSWLRKLDARYFDVKSEEERARITSARTLDRAAV